MARAKKLADPVTLFAAIEQEQHEALRQLAFEQRRSLADVTREALAEYISRHLVSPRDRRRTRRRVAGAEARD
jgi:hypothetical protein